MAGRGYHVIRPAARLNDLLVYLNETITPWTLLDKDAEAHQHTRDLGRSEVRPVRETFVEFGCGGNVGDDGRLRTPLSNDGIVGVGDEHIALLIDCELVVFG